MQREASPEISIVVPAYNEELRLGKTLSELVAYWRGRPESWEIIVVDDGSSDRTAEVARSFRDAGVRLLQLPANEGKGAALRRGIAESRGRFVFLVDADLPYALEFFPRALAVLRRGTGAALGARDLPESEHDPTYPKLRVWMGRIFSGLVNAVLRLGIPDTQCGFKGFQGDLVRRVLPYTAETGYALDLELLVALQASGAAMVRLPVHLVRHHGSKVRLLRDSWALLQALFRIAGRGRRDAYRLDLPAGWIAVPCPACGATAARRCERIAGARFVRCRHCGTYYQSPRPPETELWAGYGEDYFHTGRIESGYDDYYEALPEQAETAAWIWRWLEKATGLRCGRILDVGCGSGEFLRAGSRPGRRGVGVDLVPPRSYDGFLFVQARFPEVPLAAESVDLVVFNDSFEHFPDPRAALAEAFRLLRPGGWLLINTPDQETWTARLSGRRWISFKREHLFLPSRRALVSLLAAAGFTVVSRRASRMKVGARYLAPRLARVWGPAAHLARWGLGQTRRALVPTTGSLWLARKAAGGAGPASGRARGASVAAPEQ